MDNNVVAGTAATTSAQLAMTNTVITFSNAIQGGGIFLDDSLSTVSPITTAITALQIDNCQANFSAGIRYVGTSTATQSTLAANTSFSNNVAANGGNDLLSQPAMIVLGVTSSSFCTTSTGCLISNLSSGQVPSQSISLFLADTTGIPLNMAAFNAFGTASTTPTIATVSTTSSSINIQGTTTVTFNYATNSFVFSNL